MQIPVAGLPVSEVVLGRGAMAITENTTGGVVLPCPWPLADPCVSCGSVHGELSESPENKHLRLECAACGRWQKWLSKTEAGVAPRTLSTRPGITPGLRSRVFASCSHTCVDCGRRPPEVTLEVGHLISRELADAFNCLDELIDSEWNMVAQCSACNSGDP